VLQRQGRLADQLRDRHGASRAVAYLLLIGAPYVFVTGVFLTRYESAAGAPAVAFTCVCLAACGWVARFRPGVLPDLFWIAAPFVATAVISGLNVFTNDATTGAQLFYLWPVFYAANFLSRRVVYACLVVVLIGEALVLGVALDAENAVSDWVAMTLAMTTTTFVVLSLRERGDLLLRRLEGQALADPLTGLSNRRSFDEELDRAGVWSARTGRPLALVTVDLDHFKGINDTYGHAVGDQALQAVATAMLSVGEQGDVMARLGGDEFVMLLRADLRGALRTTETLREAVAAVTSLPSGAPRLSIGVAVLPEHATTVDELAKASDIALYEAKSRGRGRVAVAEELREPAARQNVDRPALDVQPTPPVTPEPVRPTDSSPPMRGDAMRGDAMRGDAMRGDPMRDEPMRDDPMRDEPMRDDPKRGDPSRDDAESDEPRRGDSRRDDPRTDDPSRDNPWSDDPGPDASGPDDAGQGRGGRSGAGTPGLDAQRR
jgi:diguanylate cyclase (GGDEF)-like protein